MSKFLALIVGIALVLGPFVPHTLAEEGQAESIGKRLDRGLEQISEKLKKAWEDAKQSVDELGIQGRVYARLRWDKALADHKIDIQVQKKDIVVLTGTVPDEAALDKALQLAQDTIGVREVVIQLQMRPRPAAETETPKIDPPQ
jgi:osmotically-inducible protein OsmY